ncbi:MAG: lycopene cyclase domain-containing protein [Bacteroidales bacterium]|nr:lycopene cyclase domain-containing protein [Bacteroidales bacterium]MCB9000129.1 lycopene cyclase domain-containing protein [Bacteroidales bacterium]MCB9014117.1 lycopene cyclase domain-containing protein [Bacteroidales bacterium]
MSTYLLVNILAFSIPFVLSFDKKVHFYTQWKYLFPSFFLTMLLFIPWDVFFTVHGIWGFNELHLSGIYLFHLPLEEWLFFIVVPYASVFTYEVFIAYLQRDYLEKYSKKISMILIIVLLAGGIYYFHKAYTASAFLLAALAVFLNQFVFKVKFMGRFYFAYLVILIPFLLVNGVLTGSFIHQEIVWYNNAENLALRIGTIPVEDSVYGLLLILMNVSFYEYFRGGKIRNSA